MALVDLSPDKITKVDLSSFCEQMDQMYFLPAEKLTNGRLVEIKPKTYSPNNLVDIGAVPKPIGRVSMNGLVSAIDFLQLEGVGPAGNTPRTSDQQQLLPAHSAGRLLAPALYGSPWQQYPAADDVLASTVDWCGQPTSRAQWLKKRINHASGAQSRSASSLGRQSPQAAPSPTPQQPLRASSARPASAATTAVSISAEYRDLSEADLAADVAVRRLGGSSCSSPDERRFWLAARRPFLIRKSLPESRTKKAGQSRLEFLSLFGPAPDSTISQRKSNLADNSATAFEPPPASPSSRPATANNAAIIVSHRQFGRPLTGRPRPPAGAAAATATVGSFSDFSDIAVSPRPPAAAPSAKVAGIGVPIQRQTPAFDTAEANRPQPPPPPKLQPQRQRWRQGGPRRPIGAQPTAAPARELELLGSRFRFQRNGFGAIEMTPANQRQSGSTRPRREEGEIDSALADLEQAVIESAMNGLPVPSISFNGSGSGPDFEVASQPGTIGAGVATKDPKTAEASGSDFDEGESRYSLEAELAAVVIQSGYRGYKTRQRLSRVDQLARAQGYESVKAIRLHYCELMGAAHRPGAQEMLNFLENIRRIGLAFEKTVGPNARSVSVKDMTKVFNLCGQFPRLQAVEQALIDWRRRNRQSQLAASPRRTSASSSGQSTPLTKWAAVEIFYRLLAGGDFFSPRRGVINIPS